MRENVSTLAEKALGAGAKAGFTTFAIPKSMQSFGIGSADICSVATPSPAQCNSAPRGRAAGSLAAAGSGCGCRVNGPRSGTYGLGVAFGLTALCIVRRRRSA